MFLAKWLTDQVKRRDPDIIIGADGETTTHQKNPYLWRWHLIPRNPIFNVYVHCFWRGDNDRELHDHPWWNLSIILEGHYLEEIPSCHWRKYTHGRATTVVFRGEGDVIRRRAGQMHRIYVSKPPVYSLFITGPKIRDWGFYCAQGWVDRRDFREERYPRSRGRRTA
jgi:hypothetical protein